MKTFFSRQPFPVEILTERGGDEQVHACSGIRLSGIDNARADSGTARSGPPWIFFSACSSPASPSSVNVQLSVDLHLAMALGGCRRIPLPCL